LRVCVCVSCLGCNVHAPYCHLRAARLYSISPHSLIHSTIQKKKKVTENQMCVLNFSTTFVWNISHSKKKWVWYDQNGILVFMKSTGFSCLILIKLEFWQLSKKNTQISNFIKFHPVGAELFHADRQTDMMKLIITFRNSRNAPKNLNPI